MKKTIIALSFLLLIIGVSCEDFLDKKPNAILSQEDVTGPEQIDKLVTAAYSMLGNDNFLAPLSLWPYGNVRSDDAYKGGRDLADIPNFHFFEISENINPSFGEPDAMWYNLYIGISRANAALRALNSVDEEEFEKKAIRQGEMRFVRGHFYFLLKILFKNIPYVDETVPEDEYGNISNVELSNEELWNKIAEDFKFAYENLPEMQEDKGRADKYAAATYLAKVRLYQAYEQGEDHSVTNINADYLKDVLTYTEEVMSSQYHLEDDFGFNFLPGDFENGPEAIFSIQFSHDDGTQYGRLNFGDVVTVPQGLGCCDFHKPSQNLVNAFKTDEGLPMFQSYNENNYNDEVNTTDPRLYHTVAMPGYPFKYNPELIYEESWNRNPGVYGVYASLKENVDPSCDCFVNIDPFYGNSKNRIVLRYADVLLMRAEALIELNREQEALPLINQVRERAKNSTKMIPYAENTQVTLYEPGVNCNWTNEFARKALRWERRLEFAMEGNRFFDLVRWGVAGEVLNEFYDEEAEEVAYYKNAHFDENREEYIPIPEQQINFSKGVYEQNPNY
ncbi:RagB/SusD family nutrient uptake outer membrane protein [Anaerophaga thermohalophila]|uniref:RagB/SusD family nutrient uptake outer membrane protein n=1 Tax=Anaerophaga thermohalophila TaxID=177400 RepID=UPI000237D355|nr:RagB/SusD family nutrient uptake outer membrane protein [Anaerophaga thermohalophila]